MEEKLFHLFESQSFGIMGVIFFHIADDRISSFDFVIIQISGVARNSVIFSHVNSSRHLFSGNEGFI